MITKNLRLLLLCIPFFIAGYVSKSLNTEAPKLPHKIQTLKPSETPLSDPEADARDAQIKSNVSIQANEPTIKLMEHLQKLTPKKVADIYNTNDHHLYSELYYLLTKTDPEHALVLLKESTEEDKISSLRTKLVLGWSEVDPIAALEWFQGEAGTMEDNVYTRNLQAIYRQLCYQHPQHALSVLDIFNDSKYRNSHVISIASGWSRTDPQNALNWLKSLENTNIPKLTIMNSYVNVVRNYAELDPEKASHLVNELNNSDLQSVLVGSVATSMASKNIDDAIAWIGSLEVAHSREQALSTLIEEYGEKDPDKILQALSTSNNLSTPREHSLLASAFANAAKKQPSAYMEKLDDVPYEARGEAASMTFANWLLDNDEAAKTWLIRQEDSWIRDTSAIEAAEYYFGQSATLAVEMAGLITDSETRLGMLQYLVENATFSQLQQLQQLLPNAPVPNEEANILKAQLFSRMSEDTNIILPFGN